MVGGSWGRWSTMWRGGVCSLAVRTEDIIHNCLWQELGLKDSEYERIERLLGRHPNWTELGMFSVLWSEHCGYKHSKTALQSLPTQGEAILVGPGENAGVVDLGHGLALTFKVESHNHPIAIEPYQGAATGIGGIVRDILAMGARPIALLDSLRFGPLEAPWPRHIFSGVVAGIAGYGNCLGLPTVGGETYFDEGYAHNPLCNVMCVGLMRHEDIQRGVAAGVGNSVMLLGHSTGRDGIHGCTFASEELGENSPDRRPAVQVGDPFVEKLLIEACLELQRTDVVVGVQDMGAAGITSSCAETASRAGTGIEIDVTKVPLREKNMTPYDIMLSESQERMLLIVERGKENVVEEVAERWGLHVATIGRVTDDGLFRVYEGSEIVAEVPARALTDQAPIYRPLAERPTYLDQLQPIDEKRVQSLTDRDHLKDLKTLLGSANLASRRWIYQQYDHMVRTDTVIPPGGDAAVLRVKGTSMGVAVSVDGNGRYTYLDPYTGGAAAVAEAARNIVCTGGRPLAITNCLNFGNPEKPGIYYQFAEAVRGMGDACRALGTPVTGGNVSFYNESDGKAVYPTPVVGMVGLLLDIEKRLTVGFKRAGDIIVLLGDGPVALGGSEYAQRILNELGGIPPALDLEAEAALCEAVLDMVQARILSSCHDVSDGGLAVALAECAFRGDAGATGAKVHLEGDVAPPLALFAEGHSRIVVSCAPPKVDEVVRRAQVKGVPVRILGQVASERFSIFWADDILIDEDTNELTRCWQEGIPCMMS